MHRYKRPFDKGNLYVTFEIAFPESGWTDSSNISKLEKILPPRKALVLGAGEAEDVVLTEVDPRQQRQQEDDQYDDEDERGQAGGPGVQCAQQ